MRTYRSKFPKVLIGAVVLVLGCNLSSELGRLTTNTGSGAVSSLENVKDATVQIEAQGSFVDPQVGLQQNVAGRGSGFIIDESGIAVTNNHVVTGAAFLSVWVGGEREPRNARVLGVSECSDLAVIDIEGEGYPYLEWFEGPISTGVTVFAAGFPLGDPEFTLTRGIISKENARGETNWASVDAVLEHDATINPGNSGGPLVDENGKVVGVNFAGSPQSRQQFSIAPAEAIPVIEQLRTGQHVDSIGVNGTAVNDGQALSGIWVSSVQSGSPADQAGLKGGDIITRLERLVLATDGTMADYCDILRGHDIDDTLSIEVLRFATQELLEGQLNGRELEQSFSFAQELGEAMGEDTNADRATYDSFVTVSDDSGAITMEVPEGWDDVDGSAWTDGDQVIGAAIAASTDLQDFSSSFSTPGVVFVASKALAETYEDDLDALLDSHFQGVTEACTPEGRYSYGDAIYQGLFNFFTDCGGTDTRLIVVAAQPEDGSFTVLLTVQVVSEADLDAADRILDTFQVAGDLP